MSLGKLSHMYVVSIKGILIHDGCELQYYRIGGVMVNVITSSAVDRGFEPRSGQTKDNKISICCFSAKHAALRKKSKDWLARYPDNVYVWSDMFNRGLLFQ